MSPKPVHVLPTQLGPLLRSLREHAGLTQAELASRGDFRRDYLASIESGRVRVIYPGTLNQLCKALQVPGWVLLRAMGYETDVANGEREPAEFLPRLLPLLARLSERQHEALIAWLEAFGTDTEDVTS